MKRQTLLKSTLCLLMALVCNVAWAQTFVMPETGKYYKIKGDNSQYPWLTGTLEGSSIVVSANGEDAAVFEKTENGLMVLATGKYLGMNGSTVSLIDNEAAVTIGGYNDGNATGNGIKYSIKVVNGSYMYNNNTDGKTHESSDWLNIERYWGFIEVEMQTQTYTINYQFKGKQVATTTLVYPVDMDVPEARINNAVPAGYLMQNYTLEGTTYTVNVQTPTSTDGPIVTFTNVQKDGTTTFTLYINENDQLAISNSSAANLGNAAKFRATLLPNGKYTYYNEEKGLYMIWKGSSGGHNSNKGVLGEYNATYCDWSVNQSTNLELGYLLVSKRANGNDGSLVIMKATGAFDAFGNTEGWHDNYSNLYRIDIVEQAPRTTDFVYNVTDGAYASNGWCKSWASNDAAKPNLTISVDVNNVNGGQANGIGLRPGQAGSATYTVTAGCTMLSLSFEAKGTDSHKISINGVEKAVGTKWKRFVIHNINAATAEFILKEDNGNDCLLRNVRFVTPALPLRAEVEGSWADNPNTHFGRVTATAENNVTTMNLTTDHEETTHMLYGGGVHEVGFTREYRGFEFQGFFLGGENLGKSFTLTEEQEANITEQNPLVAKFTATDEVTLFYDDDEFSYRIPAIATTSTGRLIAVSDYRHCLDDIGMNRWGKGYRIDLVIRTSDDNGKTWSPKKTIAEGIDNSQADDCAYGDAAIAVVGNEVIVMAVAGATQYNTGNESKRSRLVRVYSSDNGENWEKTDITENVYGYEGSLYPNVYTSFFGSGKLAVDSNFNNSGTARIYGSMLTQGQGNIVIYSDDKGLTWHKLGGRVAGANEPKVEILPSGQILFSARRGGGRNFNVFTYTNKGTSEGEWSTAVNGCDNGGSNGTNGEIFLIDAKNASGDNVKLLLQSQPAGGGNEWDRRDVSIWYKEIDGAADHNHTPGEIAAGWSKGLQVSSQLSAYSAMALQEDGKIAFFFEEAPCYADNKDWGYCMVYMPLTIENITKGNYFSKDATLPESVNVNVVLTDAQGNTYNDAFTSALNGIEPTLTTNYPFITLGADRSLSTEDGVNYTYANTVAFPFKVSNEETIVWHNIYWPSNTDAAYPIYLSASASGDTYVGKVTERQAYGNSSSNTAANAAKIGWAVYNVDNGFTFKFKNQLTGKFIQVSSVADDNNQNVKYVAEAEATAFELVPDAASYNGDYALKAVVNSTEGYLCSTSASYGYATHYNGAGHQGAWLKFVEAPDYEELIASITEPLASGMYGDGLGQYKPTGDTNLSAIRTAMESSSSVKLNTLNSYKALLDAATLNMPVAGQFFRVAYDYGNAGKLYMQSTASTVKGLQFAAETGAASIWVYYEGALYSYAAGQCLREHGDDRGLQAVGGKTTATFSGSTRAKGKYNIVCGSYVHANSSNGSYYTDHCSGNDHEAHDLILEEVDALPITIAAIGYGTLYTPVALSLPEGVKAYAGTLNDAQDELTLTEVEAIPANTGVVLYRAEGSEETNHEFEITTGVAPVTSHFVGSVATTAKSGNPFTLQTHESSTGVAFKLFTGTNITGFKAYLNLTTENTAEARAVRIRFAGEGDLETGIESVAGGQQPAAIYDLQGRRVMNPTKGMYIIDGKKVIF